MDKVEKVHPQVFDRDTDSLITIEVEINDLGNPVPVVIQEKTCRIDESTLIVD